MLQTWYRALQQRCSCQCAICKSTASGVGRQTAGRGGRRLFNPPTSGTLFYSTVFATAAVADAVIKDRRREKWDDAIAQAKEGLEDARNRSQVRSRGRAIPFELETEDSSNTKQDDAVTAEEQDNSEEEAEEAKVDRVWTSLPTYTGGTEDIRPEWPVSTGPSLDPDQNPPESLWSSDRLRREKRARRWSPKKLRITELGMLKLMMRLYSIPDCNFRRGQTLGPGDQTVPTERELSELRRDQLSAAVDEINSALTAVCDAPSDSPPEIDLRLTRPVSFEQDDEGRFHALCRTRNEALHKAFDRHYKGYLSNSRFLSILEYHLLDTTAPPDVQTFNVLLAGFARLRAARAFDEVWKSFREVNARPNESTYITCLNHYIDSNRSDSFLNLFRLMRGQGRGLRLARPDLNINERNQHNYVLTRTGKKIHKANSNPVVMDSVIRGLVKFAGFERAVPVIERMTGTGWGISMRGFQPLLTACVERRDWENAQSIWAIVTKLAEQSSARLSRLLYKNMIDLSYLCDKQIECERLMDEARSVGYYNVGVSTNIMRKDEARPDGHRKVRLESSPPTGMGDSSDMDSAVVGIDQTIASHDLQDYGEAGQDSVSNVPVAVRLKDEQGVLYGNGFSNGDASHEKRFRSKSEMVGWRRTGHVEVETVDDKEYWTPQVMMA